MLTLPPCPCCSPAAYVLAIWPHTQAIALSKASKDLPEFDNSSPRGTLASLCRLSEAGVQARTAGLADASS